MITSTNNQINMHKCNICGNEMKAVDDINLKGFVIHGWRCECGNEHSDPKDVDNIVKRKMKL